MLGPLGRLEVASGPLEGHRKVGQLLFDLGPGPNRPRPLFYSVQLQWLYTSHGKRVYCSNPWSGFCSVSF